MEGTADTVQPGPSDRWCARCHGAPLAMRAMPIASPKVDGQSSQSRVLSPEETVMARQATTAEESVHRVMRKYERGTLKSGRSGVKVKSRAQAIAIGLSEARKRSAKVPAARKPLPSRSMSRSRSI